MSVCVLLRQMCFAKTAESIEMPFGCWLTWGPGTKESGGQDSQPRDVTRRWWWCGLLPNYFGHLLTLWSNVCRMPLNKWQIEPSRLLESLASTQQASELTHFINLMMTSVIRQLSCVCRHADDMFSELAAEANVIMLRSNQLSHRVSLLKLYTTQLSPADEKEGLFTTQLLLFQICQSSDCS